MVSYFLKLFLKTIFKNTNNTLLRFWVITFKNLFFFFVKNNDNKENIGNTI